MPPSGIRIAEQESALAVPQPAERAPRRTGAGAGDLLAVKALGFRMSSLLRRFVREDDGQDIVYAMLIALIALAVVAGVGALATAINTQYNNISTSSPLTASSSDGLESAEARGLRQVLVCRSPRLSSFFRLFFPIFCDTRPRSALVQYASRTRRAWPERDSARQFWSGQGGRLAAARRTPHSADTRIGTGALRDSLAVS